MNFEVLKTARISQGMFARIMKVTPATVSYWISGRNAVAKRHAAKVERILGAVAKAVADGSFPPKDAMGRTDTLRYVVGVLKEKLSGQ